MSNDTKHTISIAIMLVTSSTIYILAMLRFDHEKLYLNMVIASIVYGFFVYWMTVILGFCFPEKYEVKNDPENANSAD